MIQCSSNLYSKNATLRVRPSEIMYGPLAYTKPFIPLHSVAFHKSIWPQSQYKRPIEIDTQAIYGLNPNIKGQ